MVTSMVLLMMVLLVLMLMVSLMLIFVTHPNLSIPLVLRTIDQGVVSLLVRPIINTVWVMKSSLM